MMSKAPQDRHMVVFSMVVVLTALFAFLTPWCYFYPDKKFAMFTPYVELSLLNARVPGFDIDLSQFKDDKSVTDSPFYAASVSAVVCVSLAILSTAMSAIVHVVLGSGKNVFETRSGADVSAFLIWTAALCLTLAPILYVAISFSSLNGGGYMAGMWICAIGAACSDVIAVFMLLMRRDNFEEYEAIPSSTSVML